MIPSNSWDISTWVFHNSIKSPALKKRFDIRFRKCFSNCFLNVKCAFHKVSAALFRSSGCLDSCLVHNPNNSSVVSPDLNSSTRKVVSAMSKGRSGSVACNWKGEYPVTQLTVIWSANIISDNFLGHSVIWSLHALLIEVSGYLWVCQQMAYLVCFVSDFLVCFWCSEVLGSFLPFIISSGVVRISQNEVEF